MDIQTIISSVTQEVINKLHQNSASPSYSSSKQSILCIFCGGDVNLDETLAEIKKISDSGRYHISALLTKASEYIIGKDRLRRCAGIEDFIHTDGYVDVRTVISNAEWVLLPTLTLNTLSKVATLITDSVVTNAILQSIMRNKKIIAVEDSIVCCGVNLNNLTPLLKRDIEERIQKLQNYGISFMKYHQMANAVLNNFVPAQIPAPSYYPENVNPVINHPVMHRICESAKYDCSGCGLCAHLKPESVQKLVDAGAHRIGASVGIKDVGPGLANFIDHTLLKADAKEEEVIKLCAEARKHRFASVCVNPAFISLAKKQLEGSKVMVCTVIGFPLGATTTETKAFETIDAINKGADEIDMVINVGALKSGNQRLVEEDIRGVVQAAGGKTVKVILETALLTNEEKVIACTLSKKAKADYVKTSTGFGPGGATVEDIALMRASVGPEMGVKASGGVRDYSTAQAMVNAGATRIGASASISIAEGSMGKQEAPKLLKGPGGY